MPPTSPPGGPLAQRQKRCRYNPAQSKALSYLLTLHFKIALHETRSQTPIKSRNQSFKISSLNLQSFIPPANYGVVPQTSFPHLIGRKPPCVRLCQSSIIRQNRRFSFYLWHFRLGNAFSCQHHDPSMRSSTTSSLARMAFGFSRDQTTTKTTNLSTMKKHHHHNYHCPAWGASINAQILTSATGSRSQ